MFVKLHGMNQEILLRPFLQIGKNGISLRTLTGALFFISVLYLVDFCGKFQISLQTKFLAFAFKWVYSGDASG
jgi:hypothetical protein